jgi:glycosyltransferase involved in cell wall biosynthesis
MTGTAFSTAAWYRLDLKVSYPDNPLFNFNKLDKMPIVSVIIPTFNREKFLPQAMHSILDQAFTDLELVIVDDGSTDNTKYVVAQINDPRIRYVFQNNQGRGAAINKGIEASQGKYICKLDSDDWHLSDSITSLVTQIDENPEWGVVAGGYILVDEKGGRIAEVSPWVESPEPDLQRWLTACPVLWPGALIRREWIDRIGGFDPQITWGDDWDYGLRLARAGCKMGWLKKAVFCYRQHEGATIQYIEKLRHDRLYFLDKFFADPSLPEEIKKLKNETYIRSFLNLAGFEYAAGDIEEARKDFSKAIEMDHDILAYKGKRLFFTIAWWAKSTMYTLSPEKLIQIVLDHLPETAIHFRLRKRQAMGEFATVQFFEAYRTRNWPILRQYLWMLLRNNPIRALDRGVISIGLERFLGMSFIRFLKRIYHKVRGRIKKDIT